MADIFAGLTHGFQEVVDAVVFLEKAVAEDNEEKINSALYLLKTWRGEVADSSYLVKGNLKTLIAAYALGVGRDPFAASRKVWQDIQAKYHYDPHPKK